MAGQSVETVLAEKSSMFDDDDIMRQVQAWQRDPLLRELEVGLPRTTDDRPDQRRLDRHGVIGASAKLISVLPRSPGPTDAGTPCRRQTNGMPGGDPAQTPPAVKTKGQACPTQPAAKNHWPSLESDVAFRAGPIPRTAWSLLCSETDATSVVPETRWNAARYQDPSPAKVGKIVTCRGGFYRRDRRIRCPILR